MTVARWKMRFRSIERPASSHGFPPAKMLAVVAALGRSPLKPSLSLAKLSLMTRIFAS
jgi:hypothetical protein